MTTPTVSVVVATYQRSRLLPRLLAALEAQQDAPPFEVVVVDNGSTDDTPRQLAALAETSPLELRRFRLDRNRGPAPARNLGVAQARGEFLAFTDDDCVPTPGWLAGGVAALQDGATVAVGRTGPPDHQPRGPFSRQLVVEDTRFFQTANVFYRRAQVDQVGGFDPAFRNAAGEDTDLGLRVLEHVGGATAFVSDAVVHHDVTTSDWRTAVRTAARWADLPLVFHRHPDARYLLHRRVFWKATHPETVLALVALAVACRWRPAAIGLLPWVDLRLRRRPVSARRRERLATLPGVLLVDATEVVSMLRGAVRHRVLVL